MLSLLSNLLENPSHFYTLVGLAAAYLAYLFLALIFHRQMGKRIIEWNKEKKYIPQKSIYSWKGVEISPLPVDQHNERVN